MSTGDPTSIVQTSRPNFIAGIGGSAGSVVAYKALLDALPGDTGMAFVIVCHFLPTAHSELAAILSRHTQMPVVVASPAMKISADHVYVCPPNTDLLIESRAFKLSSPRTRNKQVDLFLTSLAEAMGPRAIGIIFSGYDGDGTEGCKEIKAKGGTTFAQDESAAVGDMPLSAQLSGCVDFVLPPDKIGVELQRLASAYRVRRR
jgi:two-component system CheB/CheR fusion protein